MLGDRILILNASNYDHTAYWHLNQVSFYKVTNLLFEKSVITAWMNSVGISIFLPQYIMVNIANSDTICPKHKMVKYYVFLVE